MPETPDFNRIAREIILAILGATATPLITEEREPWVVTIAEKLREIWNARGELASRAVSQAYELAYTDEWNARGAADLSKIEAELSSMMGSTAAGPYVKNLDRALRTLDR